MCSCSVKRYVSQWTFVCLWGPAFLHSVSRLSNVSDKEAQRNVRAIGLLELWKVPSRDSVPSSRSDWRGSQNTRRLVFLGLPRHHTTKAWVWRHQVTCSSCVLMAASRPAGKLSSYISYPRTALSWYKDLHKYSGFRTWSVLNCPVLKQKRKHEDNKKPMFPLYLAP